MQISIFKERKIKEEYIPNATKQETKSENTMEENDMVCLYNVDKGETYYYFNGEKTIELNNYGQMQVIQMIYKANHGKDIPIFNFASDAPWHKRIEQVCDLLKKA